MPAPADGVLPEGFFATTNLPTYVRVDGAWRMPREPRMDSALVLDSGNELWVREGRRVRRVNASRSGWPRTGEGIYVDVAGFLEREGGRRVQVHDERSVSREADRLLR